MRQRITFLHEPGDAVNPDTYDVKDTSLTINGLQATREDRITFGTHELPQEVRQLRRLCLGFDSLLCLDSPLGQAMP